MTVSELIVALRKLEAEGQGDIDVCTNEYNGGDYVYCDVNHAHLNGGCGLVMLETSYR